MLSNHPNCLGGNGPSASSDLIGDVDGPASATDNAVARFDGTTGKLIQNSVVTIADTTGAIAGASSLTAPASTNLTLATGTSGAAVTVLSASNNVGIGTTTPAYRLSLLANTATTVGTKTTIEIKSSDGLSDPAGQTFIAAEIDSATPGDRGTALTFSTGRQGVGITEKLKIASSGTVSISSTTAGSSGAGALVMQGGLATGAASYIGGGLTVNGTITSTAGNNAALFLNLTATTGYQYIAIQSTGAGLRIGIEDSAGGALVSGSSPYDTFIGTANATGLTLSTNGTKRLRIDSAGAATFGGAVTASTAGNTALTIESTDAAAGVPYVRVGYNSNLSGQLSNDAATGKTYLDSRYNDSSSAVIIRTKASGTPVVNATFDSTGAATFAGAVTIGNTVNSVSPTSPNRTVTMVVNGVTLYLAAKTTND